MKKTPNARNPEAHDSSEIGIEDIYAAVRAAARQTAPGSAAAGTGDARDGGEVLAGACVLWRRRGGGSVEVYLAKRAAAVPFLGGFWAFPGGGARAEDRGEAFGGADEVTSAAIRAAARELAEETGVTLRPSREAFVSAGRWVTPPFSPARLDARYFLVEAPAGAAPDHRASRGELADGCWVTPADALLRWRRCEWLLPPPVVCVLDELAAGDFEPDSAAERCARAAEVETAWRPWELCPGVAVCPLRTPTLPPATHTNCYLIGTREVVIVDPASPYPEERAVLDAGVDAIAARGGRVVEIWLTHHHQDHVGGARHLAERLGVPVAAHPETAARLGGQVEVARHLADGDSITLAGDPPRRLRAVFTPGHAPGHICVLDDDTRLLVAGDMVAGVGTILIDPSEGDMAAYLASLARMKALAPSALLPAHGAPIADAAAKIDEYTAHRLWREQRVLAALEARGTATAAALVADAYADTPAFLHKLAERSLIAHLVKLAAEGRIRPSGDGWAV